MADRTLATPLASRAGRVTAGLTPAQQQAVTCEHEPLCVLAGAGSGKTTVLTRRVARRILDGSARPEHTLVVTFTRKAAGELRRRLARLGVPANVRAGTFHAVALAQLRAHWADTGTRPPALVDDTARLVRDTLGSGATPAETASLAAEVHWAQVRMVPPGRYAAVATAAGRSAPAGMTPGDVGEAFARYRAEKERRGVIDLDDLVTTAAAALEDDPVMAAALRWRTRHLFVDEFQDVNPAQWRLLSAWLGEGRDLFVVGDPRQAIYSWNGADPTLLDRLPDLLGETTVLRLDDNHRSTPQVLSAANAVLGATGGDSTRPDGPVPVVEGFDDDEAEALAVARWLRRTRRPGQRWSQLAVLARTNGRLEPVARVLGSAGIPCRLAADVAAARAGVRQALDTLRRMPRRRSLRSALAELVVAADAAETSFPPSLARLADEHAVECPGGAVGEFLEWLTTGADGALEPEDADGVELSTFHRAKGLEWRAVAVVGLEDGMVPIAYAATPAAEAEERRLLYVALTRAEDDLWCSWAAGRTAGDRSWRCRPSPFIDAVQASIAAEVPAPDARRSAARVAALRARLPDAV